jgi:plastocyanin
MRCVNTSLFLHLVLVSVVLTSFGIDAQSETLTAQEQRIEIIIRDYTFMLTQPAPVRLHTSTAIILRNQDIVRHGFTSPMMAQLLLHGEGEGIAAYGKGVEGYNVDPGKTLVIRFTTERTGSYTFRCDLHPTMKGELYLFEIPAA